MADLLIEQLCEILAAKRQAAPTAELDALIADVKQIIESDAALKTVLTEKAVQINQGDATGYQVLVEGGRAYVGQHLHISDRSLVEAALKTILDAYLSKPVGTPINLPPSGAVQFVGREAALVAVHEKLQGATTVAISSVSGMGGVGKTELALQYAYRKLGERTYQGGICWVQARSQDVGSGILEFARTQLGLPQPPEQLLDMQAQVRWVYQRWQGEPILIVLDDVTDYEAVKPYLPSEPRFRVLLTTRLKLGIPTQRLELEVLTETASLKLLRVLVGDAARIDGQIEAAKQLCEWLGYLPLGLELVGRYLGHKPDLSLAQLLKRMESKGLEARALIQASGEMTASLGMATAFEMTWAEPTFSHSAKVLCGLLSVFALAPIPWSLVEQCLPDRDLEELEDCRDDQLLGHSLLSRVEQQHYQLHQLIHKFFAVKLKTELGDVAEVLQSSFAQVLTAVAKTMPELVTLETITQVESALPHLGEVANTLPHLLEGEDKIVSSIVLVQIAQAQNRWQDAEQWSKRSLYICETQLGAKHPTTAASLNNLAELYRVMRNYSKAEPLYKKALQISKTQLGAEHPTTAVSLNNLALFYASTGCYSKAEPLYEKALQISKTQLGDKDPVTATSLNNLAELYVLMGRHGEAEPLYRESLQIRKIQLGDEHPITATSLNNLAILYQTMGRYGEAESLLKQTLHICKKQLGDEHLNTVTSLNNLALLYVSMARYGEAEPLYRESLQIRETHWGAEHPTTAIGLHNFAELCVLKERYSEAESLYKRSLYICETQLGAEHPTTAMNFNNLATLYQIMECYSEAESLYLRALAILQKILPDSHPTLESTWDNLHYLVQQAVQKNRARELSANPVTQAILHQMLALDQLNFQNFVMWVNDRT